MKIQFLVFSNFDPFENINYFGSKKTDLRSQYFQESATISRKDDEQRKHDDQNIKLLNQTMKNTTNELLQTQQLLMARDKEVQLLRQDKQVSDTTIKTLTKKRNDIMIQRNECWDKLKEIEESQQHTHQEETQEESDQESDDSTSTIQQLSQSSKRGGQAVPTETEEDSQMAAQTSETESDNSSLSVSSKMRRNIEKRKILEKKAGNLSSKYFKDNNLKGFQIAEIIMAKFYVLFIQNNFRKNLKHWKPYVTPEGFKHLQRYVRSSIDDGKVPDIKKWKNRILDKSWYKIVKEATYKNGEKSTDKIVVKQLSQTQREKKKREEMAANEKMYKGSDLENEVDPFSLLPLQLSKQNKEIVKMNEKEKTIVTNNSKEFPIEFSLEQEPYGPELISSDENDTDKKHTTLNQLLGEAKTIQQKVMMTPEYDDTEVTETEPENPNIQEDVNTLMEGLTLPKLGDPKINRLRRTKARINVIKAYKSPADIQEEWNETQVEIFRRITALNIQRRNARITNAEHVRRVNRRKAEYFREYNAYLQAMLQATQEAKKESITEKVDGRKFNIKVTDFDKYDASGKISWKRYLENANQKFCLTSWTEKEKVQVLLANFETIRGQNLARKFKGKVERGELKMTLDDLTIVMVKEEELSKRRPTALQTIGSVKQDEESFEVFFMRFAELLDEANIDSEEIRYSLLYNALNSRYKDHIILMGATDMEGLVDHARNMDIKEMNSTNATPFNKKQNTITLNEMVLEAGWKNKHELKYCVTCENSSHSTSECTKRGKQPKEAQKLVVTVKQQQQPGIRVIHADQKEEKSSKRFKEQKDEKPKNQRYNNNQYVKEEEKPKGNWQRRNTINSRKTFVKTEKVKDTRICNRCGSQGHVRKDCYAGEARVKSFEESKKKDMPTRYKQERPRAENKENFSKGFSNKEAYDPKKKIKEEPADTPIPEPRSDKSEQRCYKCKEKGHYANACTNDEKAKIVFARRLKKATNLGVTSGDPIPIGKDCIQSDMINEIKVTLPFGTVVNAIIDTGADENIIGLNDWEKLKSKALDYGIINFEEQVKKDPTKFVTVSGEVMQGKGIIYLPWMIMDEKSNIILQNTYKFHLVDSEDTLIGVDIIKQAWIGSDKYGRMMICKKEQPKLSSEEIKMRNEIVKMMEGKTAASLSKNY